MVFTFNASPLGPGFVESADRGGTSWLLTCKPELSAATASHRDNFRGRADRRVLGREFLDRGLAGHRGREDPGYEETGGVGEVVSLSYGYIDNPEPYRRSLELIGREVAPLSRNSEQQPSQRGEPVRAG